MKKHRTIISLFLVFVMLFCAAGCGGTEETDSGPLDEMEDIPAVTEMTEDEPAVPEEMEQAAAPEELFVEEQVLLEEAGVKITLKGIEGDDLFGEVELALQIENDTDEDLSVQVRDFSVNGYMINSTLWTDVAAGKKANDELSFYKEELEKCGIETIADITFRFYLVDADTWDGYLESDTIQILTAAADGYGYVFDDTGEVLYEGDGIRIVNKGLVEDASYLGPGVRLLIEDLSGKSIMVQARDVSVNGFMVEPYFSVDVAADKRAVTELVFNAEELESNGVEAIEEIEFSFCIMDGETWDTIKDTDIIHLTF